MMAKRYLEDMVEESRSVVRFSEAESRQQRAGKDLKRVRQGTLEARRYLGYVGTELQAWGRESGNSTVQAMAREADKIREQLNEINQSLEQIAVQVHRMK